MDIAIITGASAGLGRDFFHSVVRRYPALDEVWLIARREDRLKELAADSPVPVRAVPLDLSRSDSFVTLEDLLSQEKPHVRILINNAGMGILAPVADSDRQAQTHMVELNCCGLTAVMCAVLPYMSRGSFAVNVASIAAFAPTARMTVYSSTKAYVLSFSRGLREELKSAGINVLAVCPGPMRTEFLDVAGITGKSKTFEKLPYCRSNKVADRAVVLAAKGHGVYTPLLFFKFYRFAAKLLPHALVMKWCKT